MMWRLQQLPAVDGEQKFGGYVPPAIETAAFRIYFHHQQPVIHSFSKEIGGMSVQINNFDDFNFEISNFPSRTKMKHMQHLYSNGW